MHNDVPTGQSDSERLHDGKARKGLIRWYWLVPAFVIGYNVGFDVRGYMDKAVLNSYKEIVEVAEPVFNAINRVSKSGGGAVIIHVRKTGEQQKPVDPRTIV